jgi:hypothetical protein
VYASLVTRLLRALKTNCLIIIPDEDNATGVMQTYLLFLDLLHSDKNSVSFFRRAYAAHISLRTIQDSKNQFYHVRKSVTELFLYRAVTGSQFQHELFPLSNNDNNNNDNGDNNNHNTSNNNDSKSLLMEQENFD